MLSYLSRRLLAALLTVAVAATLVFFSVHLLPGDPVMIRLGEHGAADPAVVAALRRELNLDVPVPQQYVEWLADLVTGDFGTSLETGLPVRDELARRLPRTLELIFGGLLVAVLAGIPLGVIGARRAGTPAGWIGAAVAVIGFSSPVFVTGVLLVICFSLWLGVLPSSGYVAFAEAPRAHLALAAMPVATIGINFMGVVARMTRASLSEVMRRDYIRTARAKGLSAGRAVYRHGLPNALAPVIAVIGVRAGNLLGGTVIIEALFNWPGISSLLVRACFNRDYPTIQGALIAIFLIFVLISLVVDLSHGLLNPKLRR